MANNRLSNDEVATRMIELRNLRKLHAAAQKRERLKDGRIRELETTVAEQQATIATLQIQMTELQTIVFGKKKCPSSGAPPSKDRPGASPKLPRSNDSFKRTIPPDEAVTDIVSVPIDHCQCGGVLANLTTHTRYLEDLPLPELTTGYTAKLVTKYLVQRGICTNCGKVTSSQDLGGAVVAVGSNARLLTAHLVAGLGMSYSQVATLLFSLYGLAVSDGEIANIMATQHAKWQPAYQQLLNDIRGSPIVHGDESPWPIQDLQGHGYAWNLSDGLSPKVCFALENSRGARHARTLLGERFDGIHISDDYAAYRALSGSQQLCWAHLYRAIRDLRYNDNLPEEQVTYVNWWYEQFTAIYGELRMYLKEPYDAGVRQSQSDELWERVQLLCQEAIPATGEPKKLAKLKAQLTRAGKDRLFVCLVKDAPCDNNRAERDLRQLVLKRKRSFGSKSQKGAQALATVLSLCTTNWRLHPNNYFSRLAALGRGVSSY